MNDTLLMHLRTYLAARSTPVTYAQAAVDMGGVSIHAITQTLEILMEEDAAATRPFRAAWVVSRTRPLPARGFFDKATELGRQVHDEIDFHAAELAALRKLP